MSTLLSALLSSLQFPTVNVHDVGKAAHQKYDYSSLAKELKELHTIEVLYIDNTWMETSRQGLQMSKLPFQISLEQDYTWKDSRRAGAVRLQ